MVKHADDAESNLIDLRLELTKLSDFDLHGTDVYRDTNIYQTFSVFFTFNVLLQSVEKIPSVQSFVATSNRPNI